MKSKIKVLAIIVSALMIMAFIFPITVSADGKLEISTSSAEGKRGDTVDVVLTVDQNPGFAALLINIPASSGFEVVEVKNGTVMRQITIGKNILWDSSSNSTATGVLLTVTIRITDAVKVGENKINVRVIECFNADFNSVSVSIKPIVINVLGEDISDDPIVSDTEIENKPNEDVTEESGTETSGSGETNTEKPVDPEVNPGTDIDDPVETNEKTETTSENTDGAEQGKSGCFSFAGGFAVMFAVLPVAAVLLTKKRK